MNVTLRRVEGTHAVFQTDDGHELVVPITELPQGMREGDVCTVRFSRDPDARTTHAKDVLNEILGEES